MANRVLRGRDIVIRFGKVRSQSKRVRPDSLSGTWSARALSFADGGDWPDNEPARMTTALYGDGSDKHFADGYGRASYGARWQDNDDVFVTADRDSKFGTAIQINTYVGDTAGWHGFFESKNWNAGDFNEIYFRLVFRFSPNWQRHGSGDKWWYWGHKDTDPPNQFYSLHLSDTQIRMTNQSGGGNWSDIFINQAVSYDVYHTLEIHCGGESAGGANDGFFKVWFDDSLIHSSTGRGFRATSPSNFEGVQGFLFWGGSGDSKTVNDWIRVSEFKASGKN